MNLTSILSKIKKLAAEEIEVKLTDVKTVDGIILNYEGDLAVGIEIFIVDETGKNPATDGEYVLEDGTKLEVKDGLVEAIEMPEAPVEEAPVEEAPVEMPADEAPMMATLSIEDLSAKIEKLEKENAEIKEILSVLSESFSKEAFKKDVQMSMVKNVEPKVEETLPEIRTSKIRNEQLNNIFKNMYKNK